jgi:signal transduction histidine kinase
VWQLAAVTLTGLSWFGLGFWYGWGYCPCTDWHWQVRARLGYRDPPSYIQLLVRNLTGVDPGPALADLGAVVTLIVVTAISIALNIRDRRAASAG